MNMYSNQRMTKIREALEDVKPSDEILQNPNISDERSNQLD